MTTRWWFPFDGMEEVAFKPAASGYVYRAPSPWAFVHGRYYHVDEAQKRELAAKHRWMLRCLFWVIVIGGASGGGVAAGFSHNHAWATLGISVLIGLVIGYAINWMLILKVRPIIAGLQPTTERITQCDVLQRQATVYSRPFMIGFGALSLAMLALMVFNGMYGPGGWDLNAVFGTVLFGACAIYWTALYMMKQRRSPA